MQKQTGFAEINGAKIYYEIAGAGHPLVFIHGGLVDSRLWDENFEAFARRYRSIRYDLRGFGNSTAAPGAYSLHNDLYALLKSLEVAKAHVIGLSLGGGTALNFAIAYPEMVSALVLVGSGLPGYDMQPSKELEDKYERMKAAEKNGDMPTAVELSLQIWTDGPNRKPEQVDQKFRARIAEMSALAIAAPDLGAPQALDPPAIARLEEIHVPTLIVLGDQDVPGIFGIADILQRDIVGARRVIIKDAAHHLVLEKPVEFNRAVLEFLNKI